jgi:hypothetical protein
MNGVHGHEMLSLRKLLKRRRFSPNYWAKIIPSPIVGYKPALAGKREAISATLCRWGTSYQGNADIHSSWGG